MGREKEARARTKRSKGCGMKTKTAALLKVKKELKRGKERRGWTLKESEQGRVKVRIEHGAPTAVTNLSTP